MSANQSNATGFHPDSSSWSSETNQLRQQSDAIHTASLNITHPAGHTNASTELLETVSSFLGSGSYSIPTVAFLLQMQSKYLKEECFTSFFMVAKMFVKVLSPDNAINACREVADISYRITKLGCKLGKAKAIVGFLQALVSLTSFSKHCLTAIHVDYLQACICAQMYGAAQQLLRGRSFVEVDLNRSTLTPQEAMRFFYYKGICHVAAKEWELALDALLTVACLPLSQLSCIAIKSVKKARVISLILRHKPLQLPKHTNLAVKSWMEDKQVAYDELETCFMTLDRQQLASVLERQQDALAADQNLGLGRQLHSALQVAVLHREQRAFLSKPLLALSQAVGLQEQQALELLLQMAAQHQLELHVELAQGMVHFHQQEQEQDGAAAVQLAAFQQMMQLSELLRCKHAQVLASPAYLVKASSSGRGSYPFSSAKIGFGIGMY